MTKARVSRFPINHFASFACSNLLIYSQRICKIPHGLSGFIQGKIVNIFTVTDMASINPDSCWFYQDLAWPIFVDGHLAKGYTAGLLLSECLRGDTCADGCLKTFG